MGYPLQCLFYNQLKISLSDSDTQKYIYIYYFLLNGPSISCIPIFGALTASR